MGAGMDVKRSRGAAVLLGMALLACIAAAAPARADGPFLAQARQTVTLDIPAQPLAQALTAFGRQAGLQGAGAAALGAGRSTAGVSGAMTREDGLSRLLAGTGLTWQFTGASTVTLERLPAASGGGSVTLDPVQVVGSGRVESPFGPGTG